MLTAEIREIIMKEVGVNMTTQDVRKLTLLELESLFKSEKDSKKTIKSSDLVQVEGFTANHGQFFTEFNEGHNYSKTLFFVVPLIDNLGNCEEMMNLLTDTKNHNHSMGRRV